MGAARDRSLAQPRRILVFVAAFAIPTYLAVRSGGYDLVERQVFALVLWWAIAVALAFGLLPAGRPPRAARVPAAALLVLVAWIALSMLWTSSAESTFAELARVVGYAGVLALAWLGVTRETWRAAAAGLAAAALFICVAALLSRLAPELFDSAARLSIEGRLAYPLGYWNAIGTWAAGAAGIGLAWSLGARRSELRALALAVVPVAGVCVYLSYSRGGVVATALAIALVVGLTRDRRRAAEHLLVAAAGCGLAIIVVRASPEIADGVGQSGWPYLVAALLVSGLGCAAVARRTLRPATSPPPSGRALLRAAAALGVALCVAAVVIGPRAVSGEDESLTVRDYPATGGDPAARLVSGSDPRPRIWSEALDAAASQPLHGIGPGTFELWWSREVGEPTLRDAHSLLLETLGELGVPGLAAVLALLGSLLVGGVRSAIRAERSTDAAVLAGLIALFGAWVAIASIDWLWELPAVTVLAFAAGGVALVPGAEPRRVRRLGWRRHALVVAAIVAGGVQIPGVVSTELVRSSGILLDRADVDAADDYAKTASSAQPWAADPYAQRAYVAEVAGRFDDAAGFAEDAISRDPDDWRHRALLARIELERDDPDAALASLREAVRLRAGDPEAIGPASLIVLGLP